MLWQSKSEKNNKNIIGYVLDEYDNYLKVSLRNDLCVKVKKPKIVSLVGSDQKIKSIFYEYEQVTDESMIRYVLLSFGQ